MQLENSLTHTQFTGTPPERPILPLSLSSSSAKYLSANRSDADVVINAEKPGRGNFVIRVPGKDEPVIELLGMKRPFAALKDLDLDEVGAQVHAALGGDE